MAEPGLFGGRKGVASKIQVQKDVVEAGAATPCGPQGELRVSEAGGAGTQVLHWQIGPNGGGTSSDELLLHFRPSVKHFMNQKKKYLSREVESLGNA